MPPVPDTDLPTPQRTEVRVCLLGAPKVLITIDGLETEQPSPRLNRVWLLLLRLAVGGPSTRDEMKTLLWSHEDGRENDLNTVVTATRQLLGGREAAASALLARGELCLDPEVLPANVSLDIDVHPFLHPQASVEPQRAVNALRTYRGRLLQGLKAFETVGQDWLVGERDREETQLRRLLALLFPDETAEYRDDLLRLCQRGGAADVARLVTASPDESRQPASRRSTDHRAPIAVIAPVSTWPTAFYTNLIKGIRRAAERDSTDRARPLIVADVAREDAAAVDAMLTGLLDQRLAGVIMINSSLNDRIRQQMTSQRRRVASIMFEDPLPPVACSVVSDHTAFGRLVHHVLSAYASRFTILVSLPLLNPLKRNEIDLARNDKRRLYFEAAAANGFSHGLTLSLDAPALLSSLEDGSACVVEIPSYEAALGRTFFENTAQHLREDTAIFFLDDCQAAEFLHACEQSGKSAIARGLRVAGYEDTHAATLYGVSTIDPQLDLIGDLAYTRLQEALEDPAFPYRAERVEAVVRLRASTEW